MAFFEGIINGNFLPLVGFSFTLIVNPRKLIEVDYSTVSQGRKRLREKMEKDRKLKQLVARIERRLSK
jgi:hypothetical protein